MQPGKQTEIDVSKKTTSHETGMQKLIHFFSVIKPERTTNQPANQPENHQPRTKK